MLLLILSRMLTSFFDFRIQIHRMLLLIFIPTLTTKSGVFIQIHRMLLLIFALILIKHQKNFIQIHRMLLLITKKEATDVIQETNSNTSYVAINLGLQTVEEIQDIGFKYIVCCY